MEWRERGADNGKGSQVVPSDRPRPATRDQQQDERADGDPDLGGPDRPDLGPGDSEEQERGAPHRAQDEELTEVAGGDSGRLDLRQAITIRAADRGPQVPPECRVLSRRHHDWIARSAATKAIATAMTATLAMTAPTPRPGRTDGRTASSKRRGSGEDGYGV